MMCSKSITKINDCRVLFRSVFDLNFLANTTLTQVSFKSKNNLEIAKRHTQLTFTYSKSTKETLEKSHN